LYKKPFEGLKVLDFTWAGVGPFHTNFLVYYGAMAIRVESATRPDVVRGGGPGMKNENGRLERGPTFAVTHPVKKYGISLNTTTPQGVEIFKKLVAWADVLVESFTAGTMERHGLGYDVLQKINPRIIDYRTCGYGHTGPAASHPGFGQTVTSLTGFYAITGWPDRPAVPISSFYTDHLAPLCGALSLITAIDYQRRTGKGQYIDQSQVETGINYLSPVVLDYAVNKRELKLTGNSSRYAAPHGAYPCKGQDRWVAIAVFNDDEWNGFCKVLGNPDWTKDSRFTTLDNRVKNSEELDKLVGVWTIKFTTEQVMAMMQDAGVAAGVVATAEDSEKDPQLKEYDFFRELEHPYLGKQNFYHPPAFTLSKATAEMHRPTLLGEYTEYVCTDILKIPKSEFDRMMKEGVFD
jgi:benzylsuccinate CoA-transferase BbsF subunit